MDFRIDYDLNTTTVAPVIDPLYKDFQSFWYFHVYMLSFAYFSVSFCCFFTAISIKSQYPLQNLILLATTFVIVTGMLRSGFLMLDAYGAYNRLPTSLLTFLYALGFPSITTTVAMTVFSIAQHCLRTEPKSFIWLIVLFHFCVSITAEIIAVNEETWRLFLQTVTAIFMLWSVGLFLLFANIRKSLHELDVVPVVPVGHVKQPPSNTSLRSTKKRKTDRRKYMETAAQTSFILRRPTPAKAKSQSCGTINGDASYPLSGSAGALTIPSSSVVSLDSLESWDQFSLPGSPPHGSCPVLLARPISMPSVVTTPGNRKFWFAQLRARPNKKDLRLSGSYHANFSQSPLSYNRKLKGLSWRGGSQQQAARKPTGNSSAVGERETTSGGGEDSADQVIHKDQDSTVINYFTSGQNQLNSSESHATTASADRQTGRRSSGTTSRTPGPAVVKSLISPKLWNFIRAHYCLLVFYLTYCSMYLYSVFKYPVDIESQTRQTAWDWFVFQSFIRTVELMVLVCLAYIVDHVGALDSCNLRQRELLRI